MPCRLIYILVCFLVAPVLLFAQTQPAKPRIAVLPVDMVLTEEANSRQNVDSLTHEIALELAKRGRYDVLPPVQTKSVKDTIMNSDERWRHAGMQADDIQLVGTALGAGYVVAGSLTRSGNKYLYHAWFYKTDGGKVLASNFIEYNNMPEGLTLARLLAGWLLNDVEPLEAPVPVTAPSATTAGTSSTYTTTPGATLSVAPPTTQPTAGTAAGTPGTALPWASIITMPTATPLPGGAGPVVTPAPVTSALVTPDPATTPTPSQPLVSASADSPTSVVINIAPGPEAVAAAPAPAAAAPLVFNNNNNNNNNLGGGGGQQQQGGGSSPPLFILMPQPEKPEPAPQPVPEPPPPERIVETETVTETVEVEVPVSSRQLLYAGLRGGIQLRQYSASPFDEDAEEPTPVDTLNVASSSGMEYEAAVFFGVQMLNFLALQADVMWVSNDITGRNDAGDPTSRYQTMFSPMNLMIGAQLKFTFWLGKRILLAPFGAFYYSMMISGIQYRWFEENGTEEGTEFPSQVATGVINVGGGLTLGVKLGPGELFVEGKVLFDMSPTQVTSTADEGPVAWNAYTRSILPSITLGYQIRFMNLKKRVEPEAK